MDLLDFDSKKRFRVKICPCGKSNKDGKFVPYVGYENKGFCHSCGKTFIPINEEDVKDSQKSFTTPPPKPVSNQQQSRCERVTPMGKARMH